MHFPDPPLGMKDLFAPVIAGRELLTDSPLLSVPFGVLTNTHAHAHAQSLSHI